MTKSLRWRAVLVLAVLAGAVALVATRPVRLGLDLEGGTQIVLEARGTERQRVDRDTVSRTLEVIRRRVDALGVAEPSLQRSGDRRIIVELPGVADPDEALAVIGRTAQLVFRPVVGLEPDAATTSTTTNTAQVPAPLGEEVVLPDEDGAAVRLGPAKVTGAAVSRARAEFEAAWQVALDFRGEGSAQWAQLTSEAACAPAGDPKRRVAIVLDREVISSPQVSPEVGCGEGITGGRTVISGSFTERESKELALLIRAGALPVPVDVVERRTIGPTLGDAAMRASVQAALIGAALTIVYIVASYRLLGALAATALLVYALLSFAVLLALGATLTLPGVAGFVLAIGMAVDANVLVFERAKDEHAAGRAPRSAVMAGFSRAWSAIADSNATTLLAALLLFFYASGAVRGFGVTLSIGVVVSMFTALVVTRVLAELFLRQQGVANRPHLLGLDLGGRLRTWLAERGPDVVGRRRRWLAISSLAVVLAVAGIATRGLSYGLEFSGGRLLEYATPEPVDLDRLRGELAGVGLPRAVVQTSGDGNVTVRTPRLSDAEEAQVRSAVAGLGGDAEEVRDEFVGPTIGQELRRKGLMALGIALAAQLVYLAVRFRWTYGLAAVIAMFHDVILLLGVFAWLGKQLDGVFLAALLTVIGYSVNDSVVVFDRIREQRRDRVREPLERVVNDACLQTVPRTINTGLGALFILVALYFLGGETLTDFALALIVGIVVGTYSSVFTAAPVAVALESAGSKGSPAPPARPRPDKRRAERLEDEQDEQERSVPVPALGPSARSPGGVVSRPGSSRKRKGNRRR
jgi:SecD/SecF fusion protein